MTPERWHRIKELFESALERPPEERYAFLDHACDGDEFLRKEVESLITSHEQTGSFIDSPAYELGAELLTEDHAELAVGQRIAHYNILALLGSGGMGEVYLAHDTRLGREIALKLLPVQFTTDGNRLRRFEQEAHAASTLSHPNVCMIHEVGETEDGRHYIAMEYVDGVTLRQHMTETRLKLSEVLDVAVQVASGIAAAHEVRVVHRDIKPENIMLRRDGYIKVLDFGLAKLTELETTDVAATLGKRVKTDTGVVMGTSGYMSPEQARGLSVDGRTDIWSLGVVLYEMIAGCAPFVGATDSDVMVSILEREPLSLTQNLPEVPPELQRIVSKALRKDREERYQGIRDMVLDLKNLRQELEFAALRKGKDERYHTDHETVADPRVLKAAAASETLIGTEGERAVPSTHRVGKLLGERSERSNRLIRFAQGGSARWLIVPAIVSLILAGVLILQWRSPPPPRIVSTIQLTNDGRDKHLHQLATDGSRLYFSEDSWPTAGFAQVSTTGGEATLIPAPFLEGPGQGMLFDISRDRNDLLVGSWHAGEEEPELWVMSVLGGPGRRLGDLRGHSACWSPDNQRVAYANGRDLYIAKSDGTESRKLAAPPTDGVPIFPAWSPDGSRLRFNMIDFANNAGFLWEVAVDGTGLHPLFPGWKSTQWGGRWTPDGRYYIFLVGSDLAGGYGADIWAIRETKSFFGKVDREPIQLTFGPLGFFPPVFSPDGKRLFTEGYLPHGELARYDVPTEHWVPFLSGISASDVDFSRDGKWVTYVTYPEGPLWRSGRPTESRSPLQGKCLGSPFSSMWFRPTAVRRNNWSRGTAMTSSPCGRQTEKALPSDSDRERRAK